MEKVLILENLKLTKIVTLTLKHLIKDTKPQILQERFLSKFVAKFYP